MLASASHGRRRLLEAAGVRPEVQVSGVDESSVTAASAPELVRLLAEAKASRVASAVGGDAVVLGCDSVLEIDGEVVGKPADAAAAGERWNRMAGGSGRLHTGMALVEVRAGATGRRVTRTDAATVHFGRPTERELAAYLASGEPLTVAGAFTIDGRGGWFVDRVDGDPGTVIGLSLPLLRRLLAGLGLSPVDFWPAGGAWSR